MLFYQNLMQANNPNIRWAKDYELDHIIENL